MRRLMSRICCPSGARKPAWALPALCGAFSITLLMPACEEEPQGIRSKPLAARTAARGETLFTRLPAEETGLAFRNELLPRHSYPYLNNGSGVAIGDVDGNGLPDVYLVSRDGPNRLFRQIAPLRFEDVTEAAGVDGGQAWGAGATMVDLEGDGDLDLYVCNTESPNLLYLNRGDGTFEERGADLGLDHVGATEMAAFADHDRDGDLDVYLLTNRVLSGKLPREIVADMTPPADVRKSPAALLRPDLVDWLDRRPFFCGESSRLLRNDGGRFTDVTEEAGLVDRGMGLGVVWWDHDGDGWPDLYVANDLESPDRLYRNNRDGTFTDVTASALPRTAYFGMGVDAADVDNDGRLDLLVADMSSTTHFKSKWLMGDMASERVWYMERSRPPQYMRNALFLNSGTERFLEVAALAGVASTDWTWSVKFGDLDNDGWQDLVATNGIPRFDTNPDIVLGLRGQPYSTQLATARSIQPLPEENLALRNVAAEHGGAPRFERAADWGFADRGVSQGAAFADLDRDGDLDVVVNNLGEPAWVYRNDEDRGHRALVRLEGRGGNRLGLGARVWLTTPDGTTRMRELTLTRGYLSSDEPVLHFGLGAANRIATLHVRWPSGTEQVFEDLEADRIYTVTEPADAVGVAIAHAPRRAPLLARVDHGPTFRRHRHQERPFDDYAVQPLLPHRLSRLGPGLAWGDADGDGRDDLFVGGAAGQSGVLLLGRGEGAFEPAPEAAAALDADAEAEDMGAVWLDADADGDLDLFVASGSSEHPANSEWQANRLYLNDGSGTLTPAPPGMLPELRDYSSSVCAADFDRDGDLDLFVGSRVVPGRFPESTSSRLLRNDGRRFTDVTADLAADLAAAGMVTAALWSDVDEDGWLDLLVAAHWQPVRVWRNQGGVADTPGFAPAQPLTPARGLWNGLAAADLDGDGHLDYVASNLGLNSKYHATPERPYSIFAADFDDDGVLDVVEAEYEGETLFPVRGRSCSSNAMPFIAEQFPTYEKFAGAPLGEIYSEDALAQAMRLDADELRSGVFWGAGDGTTFTFAPLPRMAQASPGFGIVAADLDGDADTDLVMAQNFYSPEIETGRMAGGLGVVLENRGGRELVALPAAESGLVMPQDAMSAVLADADDDGRPDVSISVNDGELHTYAPSGESTARWLRVRLVGPTANPDAIGARLTLTTDSGEGRRQTFEIHAGASYLGQSSSAVFFGVDSAPLRLEVRWPDGRTDTYEQLPRHGSFAAMR